jgi:hypothetical protein
MNAAKDAEIKPTSGSVPTMFVADRSSPALATSVRFPHSQFPRFALR